jgi:suppressor of G2 allele of SKP1
MIKCFLNQVPFSLLTQPRLPSTLVQMFLRSDWYQLTEETVVLVLYGKDLKEKNLSINAESNKITVLYPDESIAFASELAHPVDHKRTTVNFSVPKVEITLYKQDPSINWNSLAPAVTTQSTTSRQDKWSKVTVSKEEEEEPTSGDVESFFKSIYANADEDSRKAMIKSFTESGGACLSTNWKDVAQKKVEYVPYDSKKKNGQNKDKE